MAQTKQLKYHLQLKMQGDTGGTDQGVPAWEVIKQSTVNWATEVNAGHAAVISTDEFPDTGSFFSSRYNLAKWRCPLEIQTSLSKRVAKIWTQLSH